MIFMLLFKWKRCRTARKGVGKENINAVAAVGVNPFAGSAPAVFRFAINVWMKTYGVFPAVGLVGNVPIAVR